MAKDKTPPKRPPGQESTVVVVTTKHVWPYFQSRFPKTSSKRGWALVQVNLRRMNLITYEPYIHRNHIAPSLKFGETGNEISFFLSIKFHFRPCLVLFGSLCPATTLVEGAYNVEQRASIINISQRTLWRNFTSNLEIN